MKLRVALVVLGLGACSSDPPATTALPDGGASSSSGSTSTSSSGGTSGAPAEPYVDFDVNHVLVTGQSNSVANGGTPPLSTTQPFANLMFDTGVMPMSRCDGEGCKTWNEPTSFVPLVEGDTFFDYAVETPAAGLANEVTHLRAGHVVLASVHGRSGNTYQCLRKDGCNYKQGYLEPFEQGMKEVAAAKKLAEEAKKSYVVRAVVAVHGESDHYSYSDGSQEFPLDGTDGTKDAIKDYADGLVEWQRDYEASVKAITGQAQPVPLFVSQISGWNDLVASRIAQWQLDAHERAPGKVVLVTPAYAIPLSQEDCLHYTNEGSRRLGEYFAKAYARVVFEGRAWEPVRPKSITLAGAVITVTFHVPKPPLVLDTTKVAAAPDMGFSYTDDASPPSIAKVELSGPDTVTITLAAAPTGGKKRLRYAMNQDVGGCIGTPRGARGNLRDSDDTPSKHGYDLHNWSVHFDVAVP
ncbi:MAG: hypothetical protein KIT84_28430 [Labilithrix sp.]|nr:hypothetical protein [Labilithrix sp.]MCW5814987.1 hypothetical protein [Labilithrix sp.]